MQSKIQNWLNRKPIAFQILVFLGFTSLLFWHFYILWEAKTDVQKNFDKFSKSLSAQLQQFISDNTPHMILYDYERIRVNAQRILFPYPVAYFVVIGQFGEPIYETTNDSLNTRHFVSLNLSGGRLMIAKNLDTHFSFEIPFKEPTIQKAKIKGTLVLNPFVNSVLGQLLWRYVLGLMFFIVQLLVIFYCAKKIATPILKFSKMLKEKKSDLVLLPDNLIQSMEMEDLVSAYNAQVITQKSLREELVKKESEINISKIALQVTHDIRSPLSSMSTALQFFKDTEFKDPKVTDYLNLLELSARRLKSIADGLLKKYKGNEAQKIIFSLHQVLDELVGEYQGQQKSQTVFVKQYAPHAIEVYGDRAKFQRALGNIIKNAVEAIHGCGTITMKTKSEAGLATLSIQDTGPGMSAEKLERVLAGGYTEGKQEGHGIGLTVVRETVAEFDGKLWVKSELGQGTGFFIEIPFPDEKIFKSVLREANAMEQFMLEVPEKKPVIVIDDEPSMREQWRLILEVHRIEAILCESFEDFERQKITARISRTVIVDYHFENSERNGADIVRILCQQGFENIYLCTAEYWKPSVQKLAQEFHIRLCPKPLPKIVIASEAPTTKPGGSATLFGGKQSHVPLEIASSPTAPRNDRAGYKVLVIDDEEMIRMSWKLMLGKLHIETLYTFPNWEELEANPIELGTIDIAFVDKNIEGSKFTGADVINFLKSKQVGKIVLASGENEETLRQDPQFAQVDFIVNDKIPSSFKEFFP